MKYTPLGLGIGLIVVTLAAILPSNDLALQKILSESAAIILIVPALLWIVSKRFGA